MNTIPAACTPEGANTFYLASDGIEYNIKRRVVQVRDGRCFHKLSSNVAGEQIISMASFKRYLPKLYAEHQIRIEEAIELNRDIAFARKQL